MKVAVIPARGGSKRIPGKNIKSFFGQPIIAWSIQAAAQSGCFDRIIVSTDDDEIARVALLHGAEVPFKRPVELSDDYTTTRPVIAHAVNWLRSNGMQVDYACCIYATAPFLVTDDLIAGLTLLQEMRCNYVFPVTSYGYPIQRALRLGRQSQVQMLDPVRFASRSQDLEDTYHDAGQFYWGTVSAWNSDGPIFSEKAHGLIIPRSRVQDIDTLDDWIRAELIFSAWKSSSANA